ncbi:PREDICTED: protein TAPETUM DETERMINANT 1-like isoform X1 [Lupinus angustifolius]|uniref:protein TAPETUM DETERMINANT 1-like isoform X1 n=1 Tax=Lupinus angustifolius TaxID=3871 RepID=UPI00092F7275|nr:PREDICTED: protein TAPETUM DETERMINANT 1-like isoform X1 [Lupinus angustifolius]XP_019437513.1 PREDICTED: protein TAPETUM DETERMINANT 1-like isoform X1 [Lupinus angustifolius]
MEHHSVHRFVAIITASFVFLGLIALLVGFCGGTHNDAVLEERSNNTLSITQHRKLLHRANTAMVEPNRIWGDKCSMADIVITQGPTTPLPNGIPTYTVDIINMCLNGCDISGIHLSCGWFSSARLINPKLFKRLHYNDCLVNDGRPLINGDSISFQYANTFLYPLSVSKVICV